MRPAVRAWLIMMTLTAVAAAGVKTGMATSVPLVWIVALGVTGFLKGRLILLDYLELRHTPWRGTASAGLAAALALITALLALGLR